MRKLLRYARQAAQSQGPILLRGEEEVGKAQLAEAIHFGSERAAGPLITLNCKALPNERMALELMGSDEAGQERAGKFELAHGGTLVLEQVECLSAPMQAALLQLLKTGRIQRFDSARILPLKVRIIATSSAPLEQLVQEGLFGRQLLYALQACELWLPGLRERAADLPGLISQQLAAQGASRCASSAPRPSTACRLSLARQSGGAAQRGRACAAPCRSGFDPAGGAALRHSARPSAGGGRGGGATAAHAGGAGTPSHLALRPRLQGTGEPDGPASWHQSHHPVAAA